MESTESTKLPATTDDLPTRWEGWTVEIIEGVAGAGVAYWVEQFELVVRAATAGINLTIQSAVWYNAVLEYHSAHLKRTSPADWMKTYEMFVPRTPLHRNSDGSLEFVAGRPTVTVRLRPPAATENGGPPAAPPR